MGNKYKAIILEGVDCCGKSTLAKNMKNILGDVDIVHCTGSDPKDFDFYHQTMRKLNVIYDRHLVGEMIYPEIFNREPNLTEEEFEELLNIADKLGVYIFIIIPDNDVIKARLDAERPNEEDEIKQRYAYINRRFEEIALKYNNKHRSINIVYSPKGMTDADSLLKFTCNIFKDIPEDVTDADLRLI